LRHPSLTLSNVSFKNNLQPKKVFELALREPLLPGFLKLMHLEATIEPLARLGFQTAHDLAYLQVRQEC